MIKTNKLTRIIGDRPVCILAHGKSLEELEKHIEEFRRYNICWVSLGAFPMVEKYILNKINQKLDIVFDCATVPQSRLIQYETKVRLPRLDEFLSRTDKNLWITTRGILRDVLKGINQMKFFYRHIEKIFFVDDIFPRKKIGEYMSVPNSVTLLIASLIRGSAKKIILFGYDGYVGNPNNGINFYYKPEIIKEERLSALGSIVDPGINRDTNNFEREFSKIYNTYLRLFHEHTKIYNCSSNSIYSVIPKINYEQVKCLL